jgi:FKBP-type peptidyl-prolyl cis-trans isomerase
MKVLSLLACSLLVLGCSREGAVPASAASTPQSPQITQMVTTDKVVGTGNPIAPGQVAVVHYTGWLYDPNAPEHKGTKFDSSRDQGTPFRFAVGAGKVIKGWDQGVAGMQAGGQRTLVIPSSLGYGENGAGGVIPANATLLFDVELLAIE